MRLTCATRSVVRTFRSRLMRRSSSSRDVGALTIAQTLGSPRLYARSARSKGSPSILSVFARRRRREVAIDAGSTTWLSIPSLCSTPWPKAVQPGFLDDDQREVLARPGVRLCLELGQARQQPGSVAPAHLMLRHLLPPRRQGRDEPSRTREFQRHEDRAKVGADGDLFGTVIGRHGVPPGAWLSKPDPDRAARSPPPIGSTTTATATCRSTSSAAVISSAPS